MSKQYDAAYFRRWYHDRGTRVSSHAEVRRKVTLAVSMTEYFLRRPLRSVLDIGCGEGAWQRHIHALRPRASYLGLDPSEYAIQRFGKARNLHRAAFGDLPALPLGTYDLVICSDVLHYVGDDEIRKGAAAIAAACDGMAFLEALTLEDDIIGDLDGFIRRPARWYHSVLRKAGLTHVGPYCWLSPLLRDVASALELPH